MRSRNGDYVQRWFPPRSSQPETNANPAAPRIDALAIFGVLLLIAMIVVVIVGL